MLNRLQKWANYDIDDVYNFPRSKSWFGDSELKSTIIYGFPKYKTYNILEASVESYCQKYNYELIILSHLIRQEENMDSKKFYWQRLLIPNKFKEFDFVVINGL